MYLQRRVSFKTIFVVQLLHRYLPATNRGLWKSRALIKIFWCLSVRSKALMNLQNLYRRGTLIVWKCSYLGLMTVTDYCILWKHNLMYLAFCLSISTFNLNFCNSCLTLNSQLRLLFKFCEFRLVIIAPLILP